MVKRFFFIPLTLLLATSISLHASEEGTKVEQAATADISLVKKSINQYISEKAKFTGTLDLYDEAIEQVRNLKKLKFQESMRSDGEYTIMRVDFRDNKTGDILDVDFYLKNGDGGLKVDVAKIHEVTDSAAEKREMLVNKEFTDDEIKAFMQEYIEGKAKFTGMFSIFDQKNNTLRNLKFLKIQDEIRKYGSNLIASIDFKDLDSHEFILIDMTVVNKEGMLSVNSTRIKSIKK